LITETVHTDPSDQHDVIKYYIVKVFYTNSRGQNVLKDRRFLEQDLEVISGSR